VSTQYVLGIDLGTTNCVLAYAALEDEHPQVSLLAIPQVVDNHTCESRSSLPSFSFLAGASHSGDQQSSHNQAEGHLDLPWAKGRHFAVGEFARWQSAEAPQRTVSAAKSWLCHDRVDRYAPILPWNAPDTVDKISPLVASQRYLEHLAAAWEDAFPEAPIAEQRVVLTVPASFDPVARQLTHEAALAAGLPNDLVLLEEPQSAVYAWLLAEGDRWRDSLGIGDQLLVCDIGGGTTDFTLVGVKEQAGDLILQRLAVGNHLLVGGDNMDLALAHMAAEKFQEQGTRLDPWQSVALWHSCRAAKESLLSDDGPASHTVSVLGRGSKLIGGTVSVELKREAVEDVLVDGFLPRAQLGDRPARKRASGFQEIGLPFESDPAITRHLAAFLAAQTDEGEAIRPPSHVLFNGGVFKAASLRDRLLEVLASFGNEAARPLHNVDDMDHAVAQGAAYYGWTKHHGGVRIRGGVARSYYVGVETAGLAIPGAPRPLRALCVVPFGMEEGTTAEVPSDEIGLVHGQPAEFRFFASATRHEDQPGDTLEQWDEQELTETVPLRATLPEDESVEEPYVPVRFESAITELGMFELWCVSTQSDGRWKLEFTVREEAKDEQGAGNAT